MNSALTEQNDTSPALAQERSSKGGRPSREAAAKLRDQILEVALRAYSQHGIDGVTLSDIAREAKISKRTLYTRFENRDDLLVAAIEHGIERLLTPLSNTLPTGPLRDQLLYIGREMMTISLQPSVIGLERLLALIAQRMPEVYQRVSETIQRGRLSLIEAILEQAAAKAEIEEKSIRIAASIIFDILVTQPRRELINHPGKEEETQTANDYLPEAIDLILYGICARAK
ncbi:TetR/AcrR family transcriptional regulator [Pseudomonas fluorescens]|uniref:TetR/AcrR family transcriptional regulator n=1 Tax=Pseudomonas fluorescens TaxID=294 RepID=UPI001912C7D4|nr:TetR/AcrR family transcriptional regulator [Pseudomonas fluorescens]